MRQEIRFAGFGGQGVISMGIVTALAAGKFEKKQVAQTQSYGPEARGGACKTEVVISDQEIDYIKAIKPDILVVMSQPALDRYVVDIDPDKSLLIVDDTLIDRIPENIKRVVKIPATQIVEERFGSKVAANVFMMGALTRISEVISYSNCAKALQEIMPAKTWEANLAALEAGYKYAETLKGG